MLGQNALPRLFRAGLLGLLVLCLATDAGAGGKDKDVVKKDEVKKGEIPKGAITGKVKSVNVKDSKFTITLDSGKDRSFDVDKDTKFIGPRGGLSEDGLKDDRMDKGYEVHVVADKAGKLAKEVHLPYRKKDDKKDDKKSDKK